MATDLETLQSWIKEKKAAGYSNEQLDTFIRGDPRSAQAYAGMAPLVGWQATSPVGREVQLGAEQFVRGIPAVGALPGNLWNLTNQSLGGNLGAAPGWLPTSQSIEQVVGGAERAMGIAPVTPATPAERLYAGGMQGLGASLIPMGGGLGLAARGIAGAGSGLAAEATHEYAPQLGPWAPVAAGLVAGGALSPAARTAQGAGYLPGGARDFNDVLSDYNAVQMGQTYRPGDYRTDASNMIRQQLAFDTRPGQAGVPLGARGVPNTPLDQPTVDKIVNSKGDAPLNMVQRQPEIAQAFANSPTMQPVLRQGGRAILSTNPQKHIPAMDKNNTLGLVFGNDADILRNQFIGKPTPTSRIESYIARGVGSEALMGLAHAGTTLLHTDPGLASAAAVVAGAAPWARHIYQTAPAGTLSGLVRGTAMGADLSNPLGP